MSDQKKEKEKMLGALVPESLFWRVKQAAASRGERMSEAIMNAAELYLAVGKEDHNE